MIAPLSFEKDIQDLESKLAELHQLSDQSQIDIQKDIQSLQLKLQRSLKKIYSRLTPWDKVQVARHESRPQFTDYISHLFQDFTILSGDRNFGEDPALMTGIALFRGRAVCVMGHYKGKDMQERIHHNFGMPRPEGYRKAARVMKIAENWKLPIITLINTAGADPTLVAEERGQSEAIARCLEVASQLTVPLISIITGEGGSGGAVALGMGNKIAMLEHAIYSVISPEGCASILWHNSDYKNQAAESLKLTAQDILPLKVIDAIIPEPLGGAHRNPALACQAVGIFIETALQSMAHFTEAEIVQDRQLKFLSMGR